MRESNFQLCAFTDDVIPQAAAGSSEVHYPTHSGPNRDPRCALEDTNVILHVPENICRIVARADFRKPIAVELTKIIMTNACDCTQKKQKRKKFTVSIVIDLQLA